jgi:hypothetical protein
VAAKFLVLCGIAAALAAPSFALADDARPVSGIATQLCVLEYKRAGADAFARKYGSGDAGKRACLQANTAEAQAIATKCKAIGMDGFQQCVKQALGVASGDTQPKVGHDDATAYVAQALCAAEASSLGRDAFAAKYGGGNEVFGACVRAALPKAQSLLASCKSSTGDAFKQCVIAALKSAGAH